MAVGSHNDIRTYFGTRFHLGSFVDKNISFKLIPLPLMLVILQEGVLADEVVFWLPNIVPKVVLQGHPIKLSLRRHYREDFLLNHAELGWNAVNDRRVENVDASIDLVADEVLRLFDELVDPTILLHEHYTEPAGILNSGKHYSPLFAMSLVEVNQLLEGVIAYDVAIEHQDESSLVVLFDGILRKLQRTRRTNGLFFLGVSHLDLVLLLELLEPGKVLADLEVEVEDDFIHTDFGERLHSPPQLPQFGALTSACLQTGCSSWDRRK